MNVFNNLKFREFIDTNTSHTTIYDSKIDTADKNKNITRYEEAYDSANTYIKWARGRNENGSLTDEQVSKYQYFQEIKKIIEDLATFTLLQTGVDNLSNSLQPTLPTYIYAEVVNQHLKDFDQDKLDFNVLWRTFHQQKYNDKRIVKRMNVNMDPITIGGSIVYKVLGAYQPYIFNFGEINKKENKNADEYDDPEFEFMDFADDDDMGNSKKSINKNGYLLEYVGKDKYNQSLYQMISKIGKGIWGMTTLNYNTYDMLDNELAMSEILDSPFNKLDDIVGTELNPSILKDMIKEHYYPTQSSTSVKEGVKSISTPTKSKKLEYTVYNSILKRSVTKSGYKLTIPEFPNVELYLTNETSTQDSQEGSTEFNIKSKTWGVEVVHPTKGIMTIGTPFATTMVEVLETFTNDINEKYSKTENGKKTLKEIGIDFTQSSTSVDEFNLSDKLTPIEQNFADGQGVTPTTNSSSKIEGINIASSSTDKLGKKLTNALNDIKVMYKGKEFKNAEHAYQTWKSGTFNEEVYNEGNKVSNPGVLNLSKFAGSKEKDTFKLMTDILTEKFKQHPDLLQEVRNRGGAGFIFASGHKTDINPDQFWESDGKNMFIKALSKAFINAITPDDTENIPECA